MLIAFDRKQLYKDVWSRPASAVARLHGIPASRLRKLCKELDVPLPGRGHWAKVAAGVVVPRPPLPQTATTTSLSLNGHAKRILGAPSNGAWLEERVAFERDASNAIVVNVAPRHWHPAVAALRGEIEAIARRLGETQSRFRVAAIDEERLLFPRHRKSVIRAGTLSLSRALAVLNAVCAAAERRGFVAEYRSEQGRIVLTGHDGLVQLCIAEQENVDASHEGDSIPLRLFVETATGRPVFVEDDEKVLEAKLNEVFQDIYRQIARSREENRKRAASNQEREVIRRERRIAELRLARQRAAAEAEGKRRERLLQKAREWKGADVILEYLEHVEATATSAGMPASPGLTEWLDWGRTVASEIRRRA